MIKIGNNISEFSVHSCQPKTRVELWKIIDERIREQGVNCDLNDIDVSLITNMSYLFYRKKFNGYISEWDVSNVRNMKGMFWHSEFNQDISNWTINEKCDISGMFKFCLIKEEYKPKSLHK